MDAIRARILRRSSVQNAIAAAKTTLLESSQVTIQAEQATISSQQAVLTAGVEASLGEGDNPVGEKLELNGCFPLYRRQFDARTHPESQGDVPFTFEDPRDSSQTVTFYRPFKVEDFYFGCHDVTKVDHTEADFRKGVAAEAGIGSWTNVSYDSMVHLHGANKGQLIRAKNVSRLADSIPEKMLGLYELGTDYGAYYEPGVLGYQLHIVETRVVLGKFSHPTDRSISSLVEKKLWYPKQCFSVDGRDDSLILVDINGSDGGMTNKPVFRKSQSTYTAAAGEAYIKAKLEASGVSSADAQTKYDAFKSAVETTDHFPDSWFDFYEMGDYHKGVFHRSQQVIALFFDYESGSVRVSYQDSCCDDASLSADAKDVVAMLFDKSLTFVDYSPSFSSRVVAGKFDNLLRHKSLPDDLLVKQDLPALTSLTDDAIVVEEARRESLTESYLATDNLVLRYRKHNAAFHYLDAFAYAANREGKSVDEAFFFGLRTDAESEANIVKDVYENGWPGVPVSRTFPESWNASPAVDFKSTDTTSDYYTVWADRPIPKISAAGVPFGPDALLEAADVRATSGMKLSEAWTDLTGSLATGGAYTQLNALMNSHTLVKKQSLFPAYSVPGLKECQGLVLTWAMFLQMIEVPDTTVSRSVVTDVNVQTALKVISDTIVQEILLGFVNSEKNTSDIYDATTNPTGTVNQYSQPIAAADASLNAYKWTAAQIKAKGDAIVAVASGIDSAMTLFDSPASGWLLWLQHWHAQKVAILSGLDLNTTEWKTGETFAAYTASSLNAYWSDKMFNKIVVHTGQAFVKGYSIIWAYPDVRAQSGMQLEPYTPLDAASVTYNADANTLFTGKYLPIDSEVCVGLLGALSLIYQERSIASCPVPAGLFANVSVQKGLRLISTMNSKEKQLGFNVAVHTAASGLVDAYFNPTALAISNAAALPNFASDKFSITELDAACAEFESVLAAMEAAAPGWSVNGSYGFSSLIKWLFYLHTTKATLLSGLNPADVTLGASSLAAWGGSAEGLSWPAAYNASIAPYAFA